LSAAQPKCVECGSTDGVVQHVDIAWPAERWPNGRRHWSGWLHMECEEICAERIAKKMDEATA